MQPVAAIFKALEVRENGVTIDQDLSPSTVWIDSENLLIHIMTKLLNQGKYAQSEMTDHVRKWPKSRWIRRPEGYLVQ